MMEGKVAEASSDALLSERGDSRPEVTVDPFLRAPRLCKWLRSLFADHGGAVCAVSDTVCVCLSVCLSPFRFAFAACL